MKTKSLIEQHFHGAYGVNFNTANVEQIVLLGQKLLEHGVTLFYPTLHTDKIENLKNQISIIKQAQAQMPAEFAKIGGVHLEANFLNPEKRGIHPKELLLSPSVEVFLSIYDPIIKIVTLAPELDEDDNLSNLLKEKNIKVSAGHTKTKDLSAVSQVTHLFNAMDGISHREITTAALALTDDNVAVEVIGDLIHIAKPTLELVFKSKPKDKVLLISDCLPMAYGQEKEGVFCNQTVYLNDGKITGKDGVLAGSSMLLDDIIRTLVKNNVLDLQTAVDFASVNIAKNLSIEHNDYIVWNDNLNIVEVIKY